MEPHAGHRSRPHTADTILEAWGPDLATCLTEAGRGLIEGFARPSSVEPSIGRRNVEVQASDVERLLATWLNELLSIVDTDGVVPIAVEVQEAVPTRCVGSYLPVSVAGVQQVGSVPKSVSLSGLEVSSDGDGYRCRVLIDI